MAIFDHLAAFDVILVSGPQRSGTTIAAKIIAQDTGHRYVDETEYSIHNADHWREIVRNDEKIVVHCPAMCHLLHEFAGDARVAVVLMRRDLRDIIASQERIGWTVSEEPKELAKYGVMTGPIALVKYGFWETHQRDMFPPGRIFEVEYESLAGHPLWVPKALRATFRYRQTKMAFLSIITRCYKRPNMLAQLRRSLAMQTCQDFEHLLIIDEVGIGVEEANKRLSSVDFRGQYAYVLDDDNEVVDCEFVANLREIVKHFRPDVIMVKSENAELGVLPMRSVWGKAPIKGQVDMMDFVVSADVYRDHATAFDNGYCGDFHFIDSVFAAGRYRVYWHDKVVGRVQRRSWGQPE